MKAKQIDLRWDKYIGHMEMPKEALDNTNASLSLDFAQESYVIRFATDVLCDDLEPEKVSDIKEVEWSWPCTTWQMFKHRNTHRWWMRWIVSRWPVQMHIEKRTVFMEVLVKRRDLYPSAKYVKDLGEAFRKVDIEMRTDVE